MSGEIPERVTCEVCGTSFDPRESRGWCPNAACGKWQHPAFPLSESAGRGAADGGVNAPTKVCPSCGKDVRADANFCKFCSHEFPDEPAEPQDDDEPGLDACPDCGADLSSIPPDRLADCPICGTDLSSVLADQSEPDVTPADLTDCPACSADLTNIPADMRMVCPDCRVDLQEAIRTHGVGDDDGAAATQGAGGQAAGGGDDAGATGGGAGAASGGAAVGGGAGAGTGGQQAAGEAAESVDTIKGIGASYADRLSDAGVETVGDLLRADLAELSAATDVSEKRLGQWVENAPLDPADLAGASEPTGTAQDDHAGGETGGQQTGQSGGGRQAGQSGGQQAGQGGHAGGQAGGGASQGGATGGQQGGTGDATGRASGAGGQQSGAQGADRKGGTGGQQGGAGARGGGQQGGRASSGQGAGAGGSDGRSSGRNQPTVPGSSSGGQGQGRGGTQQPSYSTVVFEVMGQEIRASAGDTVGREIRTAMVEGGAPDDDAVYVHREHVRVEREGGTFYLVRLGQNSLKINGAPVGQHERAAVASGDEVSFSEVVTADVRLE